MVRRSASLALLALIVVIAAFPAAPAAVAAPANQLTGGSVGPASGTTATVFTFSVNFRSRSGTAPDSVTAFVAGLTVPLSLASGTPADGTYRGSSTLPVGTWAVAFEALVSPGNDPTEIAGPVQVAPVPPPPPPPPPPATPPPPPATPPPPPPPPATPVPATPTPATPVPATPTPTVVPAPGGPAPSTTPEPGSPTPGTVVPGAGPGGPGGPGGGAEPSDDSATWLLALTVLAAAGSIAAWWLLVARGRRHDEEAQGPVRPAPSATAAQRPAQAVRRQPAEWEVASVLDDRPIGTVDFLADESEGELPADVQAALDTPALHAEPGTARSRRMAEIESWRNASDRRSLLHRSGLLDEDES